jgi:hypothetical protein
MKSLHARLSCTEQAEQIAGWKASEFGSCTIKEIIGASLQEAAWRKAVNVEERRRVPNEALVPKVGWRSGVAEELLTLGDTGRQSVGYCGIVRFGSRG